MEKKSSLYTILWSLKGYAIWLRNKYNNRDSRVWVFGEWYGEKCGDNCTVFANYVAKNHKELELYWIAKKSADTTVIDTSIHVLEYDSKEAVNILKKAGFVFVGQNYVDFTASGFNYTSGATSVLLWHGVPWKKIGFDATKHHNRLFHIYQRFKNVFNGYTLYLSTSPKYDEVLATAYMSDGKHIIRAGYPRNSQFYNKKENEICKRGVIKKVNQLMKTQFGEDTIIITYMPTFRANADEQQDMRKILCDDMFIRYMNEKDIIVIVKSHFAASDNLTSLNGGSNRICYLNDIRAQDLLAATSLLITDYSGCFFDFLILDRPIIHFLYDYDYYRDKDRGLYFAKEEVTAGSEVFTSEELIREIKANIETPGLYSERRKKIMKEFMTYESSDSCKNIYQQIMEKLKNPQ